MITIKEHVIIEANIEVFNSVRQKTTAPPEIRTNSAGIDEVWRKSTVVDGDTGLFIPGEKDRWIKTVEDPAQAELERKEYFKSKLDGTNDYNSR